jgi:hypothetical protein
MFESVKRIDLIYLPLKTGSTPTVLNRGHSHYLNNRINQRVAFACGDDFASSYGIADA